MIETEDMNIVENTSDVMEDAVTASETSPENSAAPAPEQPNKAEDVSEAAEGSAVCKAEPDSEGAGISEYILFGLKTLFVTLSVAALIVSILVVAMPLGAMRVFNYLGMSERALNSGNKYIMSRLNGHVSDTDMIGNKRTYQADAVLPADLFYDDDFFEALDVCTLLSDRLMREFAGKDEASAKYFAEKLELYTRVYLSIEDIGIDVMERDRTNISNVPNAMMRPSVYSYYHSQLILNYRARVYLDDYNTVMLYNGHDHGNCVTTVSDRSTSLGPNPSPSTYSVQLMDDYVDYIDQLSTYIAVRFEQLGINERIDETMFAPEDKDRGRAEGKYYRVNVMHGDRAFSLFANKEQGYTPVYNNLASFPDFAQFAVDFAPQNEDEMLHQLYWVQVLTTASTRLREMHMLMYYDRYNAYGSRTSEVQAQYGVLRDYGSVTFENVRKELSSVYPTLMSNYLNYINKN